MNSNNEPREAPETEIWRLGGAPTTRHFREWAYTFKKQTRGAAHSKITQFILQCKKLSTVPDARNEIH